MNAYSTNPSLRPRHSERGTTLVETLIALAVLLIISGGLLGISGVAMITSENQGHLAARTAEYAQDKLEQLMALKYDNLTGDTVTVTSTVNCVQFLINPACDTGGSGLSIQGVSDPYCNDPGHPACVNQNVDYLDEQGNPLGGGTTAPTGWYYRRVWQVEQVSTNLKRITVGARSRYVIGKNTLGKEPSTTIVMYKTYPF